LPAVHGPFLGGKRDPGGRKRIAKEVRVRAGRGHARDVAGRRSRVPPHSTPRELLNPASQDSQDFGTSQLLIFEERFGQDANLALLGRARGVSSAGSSSLP